MVGVALVFRTNVAYNRYWEGIGFFKTFSSKWADAATFILSFDRHSKASGDAAEQTRDLWAALAAHRFSLLHACACAHICVVRIRVYVYEHVFAFAYIHTRA